MKSPRGSRFLQVGFVGMLSASLLFGVNAGVAGAVASPTVTVGAAGQPASTNLSTTLFNLADVGYQSSEFYLTGNASSYHDLPTHAAATITNVAVTSNVATITTSAPHGLAVGDVITITGLTNTILNVIQKVVASVPSTTTFTFAITTPDIASVAASGTETPNLTADGTWTVAADATQQPFKTRFEVYKPTNPASFNGTVYVEWLNVSNGFDSAADWILAHNEILRTGAVYVGVTTQATGVNAAVTKEAARYGAAGANLSHPGDSFSYDIFSQAGQAIRDPQALILGGLRLGKMIASGESQSANRMATYIDALGTVDNEYDGYFVHSRIGNASALRQLPLDAVAAPSSPLIRTDIGVPVFTLQTETDSRTIRQPDTGVFRDWEVAGSTHADMYTLGIGQFDEGTDDTAAVKLFQAMLHPTNEPLPGILPACIAPLNSGPHHWSVQAGLHGLREWVTNGTPPPPSLYQKTEGDVPSAAVVLDANGNVQGGVRSPHVDVPVAAIRGVAPPGPSFCSLFGSDTPFSVSQLATMYNHGVIDAAAIHSHFVTAWNQSVDDLVRSGYILSDDASMLKSSAASSDVGKSPLSVQANNQTITFGTPDPAFTDTITGFLDGDTAATLATPPTCGVSVPHSHVGTYQITCSGGVDDKYSFAYAPGTLTVVKADQTITFGPLPDLGLADSPTSVSVTATSGLAVSISSTTPSVCTISGSSVTLVSIGTCTLHATQGGDGDWNAAPAVDGSFAVQPTNTPVPATNTPGATATATAAPPTATSAATRTPTGTATPVPSGNDDDGCQIAAVSGHGFAWLLLIPAVGLLVRPRRR
jgi:Alpha/beta hydrolase domain/MBG domain (YGX type)